MHDAMICQNSRGRECLGLECAHKAPHGFRQGCGDSCAYSSGRCCIPYAKKKTKIKKLKKLTRYDFLKMNRKPQTKEVTQ